MLSQFKNKLKNKLKSKLHHHHGEENSSQTLVDLERETQPLKKENSKHYSAIKVMHLDNEQDLQSADEELETLLKEIQTFLSKSMSSIDSDRDSNLRNCEKKITSAQVVLSRFNAELRSVHPSNTERGVWASKQVEHEKKLNEFKQQFTRIDEAPSNQILSEADLILDQAVEIQHQSLDSIKRMEGIVKVTETYAASTYHELKDQGEHLETMHQELQEIESEYSQAKREFRDLVQGIARDKTRCFIIFVFMIALIVFIVLAIIYKVREV
eukprot:TRINITY_DN12041_c0_g1_i1.p1 TRINITY_DN12041_c0_g1~~TRINITY_DN12041_c0_g1_i1.p1  ORF type:complete len:286 (+),score=53.65 TRINITY_DN12041_c0_g1_i1:52-858(+)